MSELIKPTPEWYAVHVKSRHEVKVNERLILKGVESFLPTVERLRKWKDRKKKVLPMHMPKRFIFLFILP